MKKILFFTFFIISFFQLVLPSFAMLENEEDTESSCVSSRGLNPLKL